MKTIKSILVAVAVILATGVNAKSLTADASSSKIKWHGAKVSGEHWGYINLKSGSLSVESGKISTGEFVVDMTTITCEDLQGEWSDKLVGHLNSDDFFSTAKHETSTLKVTEATPFKGGKAKVKADLTIKDITKPVEFEATQDGNKYTAEIKVERTLYDIKYGSGKFFSDLGDKMIDDHFTLTINLVVK